jgi:hypothetical protein
MHYTTIEKKLKKQLGSLKMYGITVYPAVSPCDKFGTG